MIRESEGCQALLIVFAPVDASVFAARPEIALGADLIAGFPTETEEHFQASIDLIADCGLSYLHAFPFSPREGTPAARMPQVDRHIVKARAARLRDVGAAALKRHLDAWVGREEIALIERGGFARLPDFTPVLLGAPAPPPGAPVQAGGGAGAPRVRLRFTGHDGQHLIGVAA